MASDQDLDPILKKSQSDAKLDTYNSFQKDIFALYQQDGGAGNSSYWQRDLAALNAQLVRANTLPGLEIIGVDDQTQQAKFSGYYGGGKMQFEFDKTGAVSQVKTQDGTLWKKNQNGGWDEFDNGQLKGHTNSDVTFENGNLVFTNNDTGVREVFAKDDNSRVTQKFDGAKYQ